MKRDIIIYLTMPLLVAIAAGLLAWNRMSNGCMLDAEAYPNAHYLVSVCVSLILIANCYLAIRKKQLPLLIRTSLIGVAALAVILLYYIFDDANLIYALPLTAVAYLYLWPRSDSNQMNE